MSEKNHNTNSIITYQKIYCVFLFAYFGIRTIPQWFRPWSSMSFLWLFALPVNLLILFVIGSSGIIGIWRTKIGKKTPNPKYVLFVKTSGAGFLWFLIAVGIAHGTHYFYNHQHFSLEIWQDPNSAQYVSYDLTPRQKMLDDVIRNVLPDGTQSEIEALLGPPTNTGYFSNSERDLIYRLGAERGWGVDSEWLLIWFDDSGNFVRYTIVTD